MLVSILVVIGIVSMCVGLLALRMMDHILEDRAHFGVKHHCRKGWVANAVWMSLASIALGMALLVIAGGLSR